jgi:hypothetical protein
MSLVPPAVTWLATHAHGGAEFEGADSTHMRGRERSRTAPLVLAQRLRRGDDSTPCDAPLRGFLAYVCDPHSRPAAGSSGRAPLNSLLPLSCDHPHTHTPVTRAGGGSVIMARGSHSSGPRGDSDGGDDDALAPTKGGSYVIGRKYAGAWEPGSPIDRPENFTRAAHYYMPPDEDGTVMRVSYRCGEAGCRRQGGGGWPGRGACEPHAHVTHPSFSLPTAAAAAPPLPCSAFSIQGRSPQPHQKPNQDSHLMLPRLGNRLDCALFGVFDGHGPKGEDAAHYCR